METLNNNFCSCSVLFERDGVLRVIGLCGIEQACGYVQDVVLKNGWRFISMVRGNEYKTEDNNEN